ncbi:MAG TPA: DUF2314 domain-containing protein, partial [Hyphomonadaceae bacterium]|nr:DUF2314 domain-containing protein [Hyphomonadaceae bacterium]
MRIILLAAAFLLAACGENEDARFQKDLAVATEAARTQLPYYWEHFEAPEVDEYDFSLRVALPRRDGQQGVEDVWVENIARGEEKLTGELMVDPVYLGNLREGAIVDFRENQVIDWAFLRG